MANYRNGSHTVYDIKYHFVWITKYRYEVLKGDVAFRLRDLLRQGCDSQGIKILQGVYSRIMYICYCHVQRTCPPVRLCRT